MARYFLDLHECGAVIDDLDGIEAESLDEVRTKVLSAIRDVMCGEIREGRLCLSCHIDARGPDGRSVMTVPFRDAIAISGLGTDESGATD
ncbi:MAG: hypothetical protein V4659_04245 [Pseudomonadota bacterium]